MPRVDRPCSAAAPTPTPEPAISDKEPAHRALSRNVQEQRAPRVEEPPEPPKPPNPLRGIALLVVVMGAIVWWVAQSGQGPATVVPSRDVLQEGSAALDVLPGQEAGDLVVVDERVQEDLSSLRAAEIAWLEAGHLPRSLPPCPESDPVRGLQPWGGPCREAWLGATTWELPAASPCRYQIFAAPPDDFRLVAECDADGDGAFETWTADREQPPQQVRLGRK